MNEEEKEEILQWACDHQYMVLALYHDKRRFFTIISFFRTRAGLLRMSAYDSTHGDEEVPRTYKIEELLLAGITRVRPVTVDIKERPL